MSEKAVIENLEASFVKWGLFIFLFPVHVLALTCFDSSSGLIVSAVQNARELHFHFSSARGYQAIPQFEGPISANDLAMIQFQTESLKEVGSGFELKVPLAQCEMQKASEGIFACYQEGSISGTQLKFSALTSYRTQQRHASGDFETQNFRLLIGKEDRFFFAIPFPSHACEGSL